MRNSLVFPVLAFGLVLIGRASVWAQWNTADVGQGSKTAVRGMFGERRLGVPLEAPQGQFRSGLQRGPSGSFYGRAPLDRPMMFSPRISPSPLVSPLGQQQLSGTQALTYSQFLDQQQRIQYPGQLSDQLNSQLQYQRLLEQQMRLDQQVAERVQQQQLPEQRLQQLQQQLQDLQQRQADQDVQLDLQRQIADLSQQMAAQQQALIEQQQASLRQQQAALEQAAAQQQQQQAASAETTQASESPEAGTAASPAPDVWFRGDPTPGAPATAAPQATAIPTITPAAPATSGARAMAPHYTAGFAAPTTATHARASIIARRLMSSPGIQSRSPITVAISNDTAVMRGTVASPHGRRMAELLVLLEPGISRVDNQLSVKP